MRSFAAKKDDPKKGKEEDATEEVPVKKRRGRPPKAAKLEEEKVEIVDMVPLKKVRKSRAKSTLEAGIEGAADEAMPAPKKATKKRATKAKVDPTKPISMYVLKFNTPILPYAKFPLTHNRYIQEFVKMYEEDKDKVDRIIGVHFPQNNNSHSQGAVGIEIVVSKKNQMTMIESQDAQRFKIEEYDTTSNFAMCTSVEDVTLDEAFGTENNKSGLELN